MTSNVGFFNGRLGIAKSDPKVAVYINTSDAIKLPSGFTSQRPAGLNVEPGMMRYNTTTGKFEGFSGDTGTEAWGSLGDGSGGGGGGGGGGTSSGATGDTTLQGQTLESVDPDMSGLMSNQTNVVGGGDFEVIGSGTHANLDIIAPSGSANLNLKVGTAASTAATIGWNDTVIDFNKPVNINGDLTLTGNVTGHTVTAQNYAVGGTNFISATRQGNFRDLEVKDSNNNHTILLTGDGGHISIDGTLSTDTIGEKTSGSGVTIDSVLLKDNTVTAHTISAQNYAVGGTNFISATRQGNFRDLEVKDSGNSATILLIGDGGDISIDGTLSADTISEKTSASGITIDGVIHLPSWIHHKDDTTTKIGFPSNGNIYFNCSDTTVMQVNNNGVGIHTNAPSNSSIRLEVGGNTYINGNVGIGTDDPGSYKLKVVGGGIWSSYFITNQSFALGSNFRLSWGSLDSEDAAIRGHAGNHTIEFFTGNSERMRIDNGGNVGIGTTSPYARLEVTRTGSHSDSHIRIGDGNHNGAASPAIYPVLTYYARSNAVRRNTDPLFSGPGNTGGCTAAICFTDRPGTYTYASAVRTSDITFYTALSTIDNISLGQYPRERMRITAQGNVGIGTTTPGYKLDVDGSVRSTSGFSASASSTFTSSSSNTGLGETGNWNSGSNCQMKLVSANNCMVFRVDATDNSRKALIQVGHESTGHAQYKGGLYLNRWGGSVYYGTSPVSTSDDRIKHNEKEITNALSIINKLKPMHYIKTTKHYDRNHHFNLNINDKPIYENGEELIFDSEYIYESGLIAQEIQNISELEFCVRGEESEKVKRKIYKKDNSGNDILDNSGNKIIEKEIETVQQISLYVDYNSIFTTHIAATQELHKAQQADSAEIAELKTKNTALENKVSTLDNKVTTLESTLETVLARLTELENTPTDEVVV